MSRKSKIISKTDAKIDTSTDQTKRMKDMLLGELNKYPIVQIACQRAGVGRSTYYKWKKEDGEFAKLADTALLEGKKFTNDMAESQLIKGIGSGNMTATIYWLKNNHPDYADKIRYEYHHTHELELTKEESNAIAQALVNIGFSNTLKRGGFSYTKEDLAEAERTLAVYKFRNKAEDEERAKRLKETMNALGQNSKKENKEEGEKENGEDADAVEEKIIIDPSMTKSEINRQFIEEKIRRSRGK